MASCYCYGSVPMKPDVENEDYMIETEDERSFEVPEIHYTGVADVDDEESLFNWYVSSIHMKKGNRIIKFTEEFHNDMLVDCEGSEPAWVDGPVAKIAGASAEDIIDIREEKTYVFVEYDLDKSEKKTYKVILEETSAMDESDQILSKLM